MQPPGDTERTGPRRARWLLAGLLLLAAGAGWLVWIGTGPPADWTGTGPPADWTGTAAAVRYTRPVVWAALVAAAVCFYRAGRDR